MYDLRSQLFYKASFKISLAPNEPVSEEFDFLWILMMKVKNWIAPKWHGKGVNISRNPDWSRLKFGGELNPPPGKDRSSIYLKSEYFGESSSIFMQHWALKIDEHMMYEPNIAPRIWTTEIGIRDVQGDTATFSIVLSYTDSLGFIGKCADPPGITVPRLIKNLCNDSTLECKLGNDLIQLLPITVNSGTLQNFMEFLLSSSRTTPVVLIMPNHFISDEAICALKPETLAEAVSANALVYYADNPNLATEMLQYIDDKYRCEMGSIRVYYPGIEQYKESDSIKHRFLTARAIKEIGTLEVALIFRRVLAQDVDYRRGETIFRNTDCKQMEQRAHYNQRFENLKEKANSQSAEVREVWQLADELIETEIATRNAVESERDNLEILYKQSRYDLVQANYRAESLLKNVSHTKPDNAIRKVETYPESPTEIVNIFISDFSDRIAFSERGIRSLGECITKPKILWKSLYLIATLLWSLYEEDIPLREQRFNERAGGGFELARGVGMQTKADKKLMRQYNDEYKEHKLWIEPHITYGSSEDERSIRIYFAYVPQIKKIVVGHCGKHIPNYSTQK